MKGYAVTRLALQVLIAVAVIWWLLYWFLLPIASAQRWFAKIDREVTSGYLGTEGSIFLLQALPIMVIAFLSFFVIWLKKKSKPAKRLRGSKPEFNIWSFPILVRSPLGMLTVGDLLFILVILFVTFWYTIKASVDSCRNIDRMPDDPSRWVLKIMLVGRYLGIASLIPFALLWIPVSRGSPLLRVIGVPFEHAVKHHIWLGSLTIWLSAAHTACLMVFLIHERRINDILSWHKGDVRNACVPAMIAMGAGIVMLATALGPVRRRFYDLFFRVHHLYLAYLVFFAFHAVYEMYILIVPVLLFFVDRFIRFVQSRKTVDVLSAKVLASGAMELRVSKPESLTYEALSFVYLLLPSLSRFQWHPFSVASSPLDGTNEICIVIKPLGRFTKKLHDALITSTLMTSKESQLAAQGRPVLFKCPFSFQVALEGPYGDESLFYLRYQTLVMVAGGIGVTPLLAMLRDIIHRYRLQMDVQDLPSTVHLIYICRHPHELDILDTLTPNYILPGFDEHFTLKIHAYVTAKIDTIDGANERDAMAPLEEPVYININEHRKLARKEKPSKIRKISPISSAGNVVWVGATVSAVLLAYFVLYGIFNVSVLTPRSHNYAQVLIYVLSAVLAVVVVGGGVMLLWAFVESRRRFGRVNSRVVAQISAPASPAHNDRELEDVQGIVATQPHEAEKWQGELTTGRRPNWKEIFDNLNTECAGQEVGVVVSGSPYMQMDIAKQCRNHSLSKASATTMSYHSVSFEF